MAQGNKRGGSFQISPMPNGAASWPPLRRRIPVALGRDPPLKRFLFGAEGPNIIEVQLRPGRLGYDPVRAPSWRRLLCLERIPSAGSAAAIAETST
jgi:hypothetical protein